MRNTNKFLNPGKFRKRINLKNVYRVSGQVLLIRSRHVDLIEIIVKNVIQAYCLPSHGREKNVPHSVLNHLS